MKHINTLCGQNVELMNAKPAGAPTSQVSLQIFKQQCQISPLPDYSSEHHMVLHNYLNCNLKGQIPVAARSKAWVCSCSLLWFESRWEHRCLYVVSVMCCHVEVLVSG